MTSIALLHDVLAARAGGERVFLALAEMYPNASLHSLMHEPRATFDILGGRCVTTSWMQHSPWLRRHYRASVPVAAPTFAATKIDADVTICSTSGLSHHVRTTGAKIVYCHTPARWLHDSGNYLAGYRSAVRRAATGVAPAYRYLDRRAMSSADRVLANSSTIAAEIESVYGIEATVIRPCSSLRLDGEIEPIPGVAPGFVLSPTRPLAYKRLDVLVGAARKIPKQQVLQLGDGPHHKALIESAPTNFVSAGAVSDAQLRWAYRNAAVVALTCAEDFGLVPLEAAAHGVHTVAPHERGIVDHDPSMLSAYDFGNVDGLVNALRDAPGPTGRFTQARLGVEQFRSAIQAVVAAV